MMVIDRPIASSAVNPNMRVAAAFQLVITPSSFFETMASSDESTIVPSLNCASSAFRRSVMSSTTDMKCSSLPPLANACDHQIDPNNRAVFADAAFLHRITGEGSTPYLFPLREISFEIIGMSDVLKGEAQHFRFAVAENFAQLLIYTQASSVWAGVRDSQPRHLKRRAVQLFTLTQSVLECRAALQNFLKVDVVWGSLIQNCRVEKIFSPGCLADGSEQIFRD